MSTSLESPNSTRRPGAGLVLDLAGLILPRGVVRDSALTFGANMLGGVISVLSLALLSRVLTVAEFGAVSLGLVTSNIVRPVLDLGINNALIQRASLKSEQGDMTAALEAMQVATVARLLVSLLVLLGAWPLGTLLAEAIYGDITLAKPFAWGIVIGVFLALRQHAESILRTEQRFTLIASANVIRFVGLLLLTVVLVWTDWADVGSALIIQCLSPIFFLFIALTGIPLRPMLAVRPSYVSVGRSLAGFAVWIALVRVFDSVAVQLDVPLIRYYLRPEQVAYYYAAYKVLDVFTTLSASVSFVVLPSVSRLAARDPSALRRLPDDILFRIGMVALPMGVVIWMFAPVALAIVWGATYGPALHVVRWLVPGAICALLAVGAGEMLMALDRAALNVPIAIVSFASNVGLLLVLVPRLGITGAALATSASYAVILVATWAVVYGAVRRRPDLRGFGKATLAAVAMAAVLALFVNIAGSSMALVVVGLIIASAVYGAVLIALVPGARHRLNFLSLLGRVEP